METTDTPPTAEQRARQREEARQSQRFLARWMRRLKLRRCLWVRG